MINKVIKLIHEHTVSSNANAIGKGWMGIFGNILQTVFFAGEKKLKFNNTHYRWLKYQTVPFDKIATILVTNCKTSTSDNKHILTIIDHLTGWP